MSKRLTDRRKSRFQPRKFLVALANCSAKGLAGAISQSTDARLEVVGRCRHLAIRLGDNNR
jgi:hypothetical protein